MNFKRERKAKADEDKYYYNSQKFTIIIHMKHYHIKHFYFLIKSTVPVWMNTFVLHCKQY